MHNLTDAEQDALDAVLDRSRAMLTEPDDLHTAVQTMLHQLEDVPQGHRARTGRRRRVASVFALSALLVGVGVSAAAASGLWSWWADDPDLSYEFTLPSGASCEVRYGLMSTDPGAAPVDSANLDAGLAEWLTTSDVLSLADVGGAVTAFETGEVEFFALRVDDDGTMTKEAVRLDENLDTDKFYASAVEYAVAEVINMEVAARDLPGIAYGTESVCGGVIQ
jgi:hypothetical protein